MRAIAGYSYFLKRLPFGKGFNREKMGSKNDTPGNNIGLGEMKRRGKGNGCRVMRPPSKLDEEGGVLKNNRKKELFSDFITWLVGQKSSNCFSFFSHKRGGKSCQTAIS